MVRSFFVLVIFVRCRNDLSQSYSFIVFFEARIFTASECAREACTNGIFVDLNVIQFYSRRFLVRHCRSDETAKVLIVFIQIFI